MKRLNKQANEEMKNKLKECAEVYCVDQGISANTILVNETANGAEVFFGDMRKDGFTVSVAVNDDKSADKIVVTIPGDLNKIIVDKDATESFLECPIEHGRVFDEVIEDALEELGQQQDEQNR